jgi:hypothetical protein
MTTRTLLGARALRLALMVSFTLAMGPLAGCPLEYDGLPPDIKKDEKQSKCGGGEARQSVPAEFVDAFYPCCNGRGVIIPNWLIPADFQARLAKVGKDGLCVPTEFAVDADYTPPTCSSISGLPGVCISTCLPEIKNADVPLPQATCPTGTACAPCQDPRTLEDTGACEFGDLACHKPPKIGKCDALKPDPAKMDLSIYPKCCGALGGRAHCVPSALVPESQKKDVEACPDGNSYCVPDDFITASGRFQPSNCRTMGREGRCISVCVKSVKDQLDMLTSDGCKPDEVCAPCYDPRTGQGTGACVVGPCDEPKEPAKQFETCGAGGDDAFCVPRALVPGEHVKQFDTKGCGPGCSEPGTVCIPKTIMDAGPTFKAKSCKSSLSGLLVLFTTFFQNPITAFSKMKEYREGVCLSDCIPQVRDEAKLLGQDGCDEHETCVPCFDPQKLAQGKVPTGACNF